MDKEYLAKKKDLMNGLAINQTSIGFQCKNLLKPINSKTRMGVTYTVNEDGSVTLSGTSTNENYFSIPITLQPGKYKVSGMPETSQTNTYRVDLTKYDVGIGVYKSGTKEFEVEFTETTTVYYSIKIDSSYKEPLDGVTFYPMIRYADIIDDTYEPYSDSVDTRLIKNKSDVAVNKSTLGYERKNELNETEFLSSITSANGGTLSKSENSITLTATESSCTTEPYNEHDGGYRIPVSPNTTYILSWESNNNHYGWVSVFMNGNMSNYQHANNDTIKHLKFTTDIDTTFITIELSVAGKGDSLTYSNIMLRYADITDDTYEPYKESVDKRITKNTSDIAVSKSDIALNRTALGYKRKNLLPYPKSIVKGGITFTCDENGYMTGNNTTSDSRTWTSANAQYSVYLEAGTYYFSSFAETVCTNSDGRAYILKDTQTQVVGVSTRETHVEKKFTLAEATTIYIMAKVYDGKVAFMIREADITDDSYEPYKPSLQERIAALEEKIAALGG